MDSLFTAVPTDSLGLYNWIHTLVPGLPPEILLLLVGWLATRGIFLLKYLPTAFKLIGPAKLSSAFTGINTIWSKFGWIINPVLMYLMGMAVTGSTPLSILFTFAGIGVREWLIKSPIPTDKKALMKLKAAAIIIVGMLVIPSLSQAQAVTTPIVKSVVPNWLSVAVGGGYTTDFKNDNQDSYPFIGGRFGYLMSSRLKIEVEPRFILNTDQFTQVTVAAYIVF